ncbi:hypothetical protein RB594_005480 [Gaeumannomyces avenae]
MSATRGHALGLCRKLPALNPLGQYQVRFAHKRIRWRRSRLIKATIAMRDKIVPFELPLRALDLDAEGSPYTRNFDHRDTAHQHRKWRTVDADLETVMERLGRVPEEAAAAMERRKVTRAAPYHPWRINEHDALSAALTGLERPAGLPEDPDAERRYGVLAQVAHHNAARSSAMEATSTVVLFMLRELQRQPRPETLNRISYADLNSRIRQASSLLELRRLVFPAISTVTQSDEGLAACGAEIAAAIRRVNGLSKEQVPKTLTLLNNIHINLESRGITDIPRSLCLLGLEAAVACSELEAAQKYVEIGLRLDHFSSPDEEVTHLVASCLKRMLDDNLGARPSFHWRPPPHRNQQSELFRLLTGWSLGHSRAQPSIRHIIWGSGSYDHAHKAYFCLLWQLGATRTAGHEIESAGSSTIQRLRSTDSSSAGPELQLISKTFTYTFPKLASELKAGPLGAYLDDVANDLAKFNYLGPTVLPGGSPDAKNSMP